jgi:hypothetical protein
MAFCLPVLKGVFDGMPWISCKAMRLPHAVIRA